MICPNCGAQGETGTFCSQCGRNSSYGFTMYNNTQYGNIVPPPPPMAKPIKQKKKVNSLLIVCIAIAAISLLFNAGLLVALNMPHAPVQNPKPVGVVKTAIPTTTSVVLVDKNPYAADGKFVMNDPLIQNMSWGTPTLSYGSCQFTIAGYVVSGTPGIICYNSATFSNFVFEVQMTIQQGDLGGIAFRVQNKQTAFVGYSFEIGATGYYSLTKAPGNHHDVSLIPQRVSSAIKTGLNQSNLLAVKVIGSTIQMYVNGQELNSISDSTWLQGNIGLTANVYTDSKNHTSNVIYSNARLWLLP